MSAKMTSFWFRTSETVLLVLAFMLPLAFFLRTYDGAAIKTTLFEAGTLVLAFAWLFKGLERGRWELPESARPLALPALALLAWTIVVFASSPYKLAVLPAALKQVLLLLIYLIALLEFGGAGSARRLVGWLSAAAWLAGLYGFFQRLGFDPFLWKGSFGPRVFSTLGDPDRFGFFLALCAPLTLTQWLDPERDWFLRWLDAGLLILLGANAVWTQSANAIVSFLAMCLAGAAILPLVCPSKESLKAAVLASCLALAVGGCAVLAGVDAKRLLEALSALGRSIAEAAQSPVAAGLRLWLAAALAAAAWRARRLFVKQGALSESCYLAGLCAAAVGSLAASALSPDGPPSSASWLAWPLAGMLGGLTALARRGGAVIVIPLPMGETARQRLYAPALLAFAGLAFFPLRWFDSEIEHNTALYHCNRRDWDQALAHFERVSPGTESYVMAQYGKASAYLESDRPSEALAVYAAVEGLSPDFMRVHYEKALAYAKLEDWNNASASHARQAQLDPSFAANYAGWAQSAKRAGDLITAEMAAKAAMALEPGDPAHQTALAEIYMKERRVAEARKLEKQAAQLRREARKKPQG
ncbi:MAG: hypothetical protein HY077_13255 [Elusimicrobia bacterium]|nr:hypothetical protein [Elusimicrobiota bacterium]